MNPQASVIGVPVVWSIAGSDSSAGAGLQADLKTFEAFAVHGCTAVAAVTAQNSVQVLQVAAVTPDMLDMQLAALAQDMPPRVIKIGMLGSLENLRRVVQWIDRLRRRFPVAVVLDPVLHASTGAELAPESLRRGFVEELLPRLTLLTPNRAEAARLLERRHLARDELPDAAVALRAWGAQAVAITGGDGDGEDDRDIAADWIDTPQTRGWLALPRVDTRHHHGTGCVFASAAAAALAWGHCEADALVLAKCCTAAALRGSYAAGAGAGPVRPMRGFARLRGSMPTLDPRRPCWPQERFPPLQSPRIGLYAIVDSAQQVVRVLDAGVRTVQLRIKQAAPEVLRAQVQQAVLAARKVGAQLFINDHWPLAIELGADGVHVGQEDLAAMGEQGLAAVRAAGLRLGVSTHSAWEVCRARAVAPSYIACGPIHATTTKDMPWIPQGEANLAYWCHVLEEPVVAIAGMDATRSQAAMRCGAAGVAVLRALTAEADMAEAVTRLQTAIAEGARAPRETPPELPTPTLPGPVPLVV